MYGFWIRNPYRAGCDRLFPMPDHHGELLIRVDSGPRDLIDLANAFRRVDSLRGHVRNSARPVREDEMSAGVTDVVIVALTSGTAVSALAATVRAWFVANRSDVTVEFENSDGTTLRLNAKRAKTIDVGREFDRLLRSREANPAVQPAEEP